MIKTNPIKEEANYYDVYICDDAFKVKAIPAPNRNEIEQIMTDENESVQKQQQ